MTLTLLRVTLLLTCTHSRTSAVRPQAKQQQHSRSLGRLKEQLRWVATETDALKRQLSDRDRQLAAVRREGLGASSGGSLAGGASYASGGSWRGGGGL